jgi:hypothetical protein
MEGYAWALVILSGCDMVLFVLKETVWWVRTSALAGCSPRGLGGMSYPFMGFESSKWTHLGKTRCHVGSSCCDASRPGVWEGGEVNGAKHMVFLPCLNGPCVICERRFTFLRHGVRPTRLP